MKQLNQVNLSDDDIKELISALNSKVLFLRSSFIDVRTDENSIEIYNLNIEHNESVKADIAEAIELKSYLLGILDDA